MRPPRVGVLALQGCVDPHAPHLQACGAELIELRRADDLAQLDGIILPGGESTTMLKLIDVFDLEHPLRRQLAVLPVWGICAGAILLARELVGTAQRSYGLLDCAVERNAYGRQLQSHQAEIDGYAVSFIRAPKIRAVGDHVEVLASRDGLPVWIRQGQRMATTFHPELTLAPPSPMHRLFAELVREHRGLTPALAVG